MQRNLPVGNMTLASILVVDADTAAQQQIVSSLRELGHDVSATENARAAFSAMQHKRPDLLVCDCQLPDLAGVDLLSDLKQNDELRSMRVLMTSAQSTVDSAVSALELGADDFVPKPLNMQEFLARVAACLRRPATLLRADSISAGGITIDNIGHRVTADGSFLSLAPREYDSCCSCSTTRTGCSAAASCWHTSGGATPSSGHALSMCISGACATC
jgi:two-component system phosphate regulon response regulator PhoB